MSGQARKYFAGPSQQREPPQRVIEMMPTSSNAAAKQPQQHEQSCGPVEKRQCTDILCCILFLLNLLTFLGIASYGYMQGRPSDLLGIYNDQKQMCSRTSFPVAYLPNISSLNFTAVCLKQCPTVANTTVDCLGSICGAPIVAPYKSLSLGDVVCIPDPTDNSVVQAVNTNILTRVFADIKVCWTIFLGALGASFILGFIYFLFMRICAGVVVWLSIFTFVLGTLAIGIYMFMYTKGVRLVEVPFNLSQYSRDSLEYTSYALWFLSFLSLLIVVCAWSRIRLAIAVVKSTSLYVAETCQIIFFPPCMALIMVMVLALILAGFFFIYSVGEITIESPFATVNRTTLVDALMYYQIFGGFWTVFFVSGLTTFVLSSSAVVWYFANDASGSKPHRPILTSLARAFRYHLGSIAFGSLLLALLAFVRTLVTLLEFKPEANPNKCTQCLYKVAQCCLACLNCFLKYLTKSAYVQIAIRGTNYCTSALNAFKLTLENPLRLAINSGISAVTMFIGKATLTVLIAVAGYYCVMRIQYFALLISSPIAPTLICAVIGYTIAAIYMSVYGVSCNAIIQCFITDESEQKEKGRHARYCPEPLRELMEEYTIRDEAKAEAR